MAQPFGLTGQDYDQMFGGGPVPYPGYRCKAHAHESERNGRTHLCRKPIDHAGVHKCICGKEWEPVAA